MTAQEARAMMPKKTLEEVVTEIDSAIKAMLDLGYNFASFDPNNIARKNNGAIEFIIKEYKERGFEVSLSDASLRIEW